MRIKSQSLAMYLVLTGLILTPLLACETKQADPPAAALSDQQAPLDQSDSQIVVTTGPSDLQIEPRVGVGGVRFGMNRKQAGVMLGKPERMMGDRVYEYPSRGMSVVFASDQEIGVYSLLFGDMVVPNSPLVRDCKYKTLKEVGMNSTRDEILRAYGPPTSTSKPGTSMERLAYEKLQAFFTLRNDRVVHMEFRM